MGQRGRVFNPGDLQAGVLKIQDRLLATGAGTLDLHLDFNHAALARGLGSVFSGPASGEASLAGT